MFNCTIMKCSRYERIMENNVNNLHESSTKSPDSTNIHYIYTSINDILFCMLSKFLRCTVFWFAVFVSIFYEHFYVDTCSSACFQYLPVLMAI